MRYEGIRIQEELDRAVQRAVRITPRRHETLGEVVRDIAAQRGVRRSEDLVSAKRFAETRSGLTARHSTPTASLTP